METLSDMTCWNVTIQFFTVLHITQQLFLMGSFTEFLEEPGLTLKVHTLGSHFNSKQKIANIFLMKHKTKLQTSLNIYCGK